MLEYKEGISKATIARLPIYLRFLRDRQAAGERYVDFAQVFVHRRGRDAARHLMEVACGLRSQILGEDQILSQVKTAITLAREAGSADGVLETLFRTAAACGKSQGS